MYMYSEKRKIILFGKNSYVITLPQKWIDKNNLKKGDEIFLKQSNLDLKVSANIDDNKVKNKVGIINYENKPIKVLNKQLISFYLKNFRTIKIIGNNLLSSIEEITTLKNKLSSVEIVNVDNKCIVLEDLIKLNEIDLSALIKNICDMLIISFENLEDINQNLDLILDIDKNINKIQFLGFKKINFTLENMNSFNEIKNLFEYRKIISSFEFIGDIIKRSGRILKDMKKEEYSQISKMIFEVKEYFLFVIKFIEVGVNFEKNLNIYLNKKNSLLKSLEVFREKNLDKIPNCSLIIQNLKGILRGT